MSEAVGAERVILGAMMQSREGADEATRHLAGSDFHDFRNARIYEELLELWAGDEPTDPVYLLKRLEAKGELTRPETGPYLVELFSEACSVRQISYYARLVLDAANARGWELTAAELAAAARIPDPAVRAEKTAQIIAAGTARAAGTAGAGNNRAVLTKASSYEMKGARWLYRGRIPAGMLSLIAGREGLGKSTIALDIAARITRGTLPGRYEGRPQAVVVVATEDSWQHTIVPRLRAVGADLDLVYNVAVREDGRTRNLVASLDMPVLERAVSAIRPALMIIDPLMSMLNGKIDTHKQAEVQRELEHLVALCDRIDMAAVGLIHVNKAGGTDALNSVMGSKAFTTLPRSVLYCIEEEDGRFMFAHAKCNIGPKMPAIGYSITSVRFDLDPASIEDGDEDHILTNRVVWGDEDIRTADEILTDKSTAAAAGGNDGACRKDIMAVAEAANGVITKKMLTEALGDEHDAKAITNALNRLTKAGTIVKVGYGQYQAAKFSPNSSHL